MEILLLTVPATFLLVAAFVFMYLAASKNGQFDDLKTPAHRMLDSEESKDVTKPT